MKVISILQPWASLIVLGHKKIETRSWNTKYRGPLLIHASAKKLKYNNDGGIPETCFQEMCKIENFVQDYSKNCPHGAIIGKVNMVDVLTSDRLLYDIKIGGTIITKGDAWEFSKSEYAFGDYSENRFGWLMTDPVLFSNPIPAKGKLGIWEYDILSHEIKI